jgi:eukaryotic-like serine/threonine-protein kinase
VESVPQVIGNCKIVGRIGAGGMGSVYRAVHNTLGRHIALKIMPAEFTRNPDRNPEYVSRFMREAKAVASLNHPNIVGIHDAGEQYGIYYISMELIDGASLAGVLRKKGPMPEAAVLDLMIQAAKGLGAAHKQGLIHRDIKPENMLINKDGMLKIVDFGLVMDSDSQSHLTRTGTFLGTPAYM